MFAVTLCGRGVSMFAAMSGVLLIAVVTATVYSMLTLMPYESRMVEFLESASSRNQLMDLAARVIAKAWKNYKHRKEVWLIRAYHHRQMILAINNFYTTRLQVLAFDSRYQNNQLFRALLERIQGDVDELVKHVVPDDDESDDGTSNLPASLGPIAAVASRLRHSSVVGGKESTENSQSGNSPKDVVAQVEASEKSVMNKPSPRHGSIVSTGPPSPSASSSSSAFHPTSSTTLSTSSLTSSSATTSAASNLSETNSSAVVSHNPFFSSSSSTSTAPRGLSISVMPASGTSSPALGSSSETDHSVASSSQNISSLVPSTNSQNRNSSFSSISQSSSTSASSTASQPVHFMASLPASVEKLLTMLQDNMGDVTRQVQMLHNRLERLETQLSETNKALKDCQSNKHNVQTS